MHRYVRGILGRCRVFRGVMLRSLLLGTAAAWTAASAQDRSPLDRWPAGVNGHTNRVYYDVHGSTFAELRADMARLGPKIGDSSFVGEMRSPMRWQWRTEPTGGSNCVMRDVRVTITSQVTLPRWTPVPDAEAGLEEAWGKFLAALETHEAGHKDIAARAGTEIVSRVGDLAGLCSAIGSRAGDIARRINERANEEQRAYDARTRHGGTQGTQFGPPRRTGVTAGSAPSGGRIFVLGDYSTVGLRASRPGALRAELPGALGQVWAALPDAFADIGFTVNAIDSAAFAMGDSLTASGPVRRMAMGEIVNCRTPLGGVDADSVPVSLFLVARLERASDSTTIVTAMLQALHRTAGGDVVPCFSRGLFEPRLIAAIRGRLPPP